MEKFWTNDSFQQELEDFIRKQRARGLHPRICFRNMAEDSVHQERDHVSPETPVLGLPFSIRKQSGSSASCEGLTMENLVPRCKRREESPKHHQSNQPVNQDRKRRTQHHEQGEATSSEEGMPKRKHHRDRGSRKQDGGLSKRKASAEPAGTEKSKHRKGTHHGGRDLTRDRRQSHREKKEPEERDLWDEAILGSSY